MLFTCITWPHVVVPRGKTLIFTASSQASAFQHRLDCTELDHAVQKDVCRRAVTKHVWALLGRSDECMLRILFATGKFKLASLVQYVPLPVCAQACNLTERQNKTSE